MARNKPASETQTKAPETARGDDGLGGDEDDNELSGTPKGAPLVVSETAGYELAGPPKVADPAPARREAPKVAVKQYRVVSGGRVALNGQVTQLRPGKLVDERTYDLEALRNQGIRLEPAGEIVT